MENIKTFLFLAIPEPVIGGQWNARVIRTRLEFFLIPSLYKTPLTTLTSQIHEKVEPSIPAKFVKI